MNLEDLISDSVNIKANWLVVAVISGALSAVGMVAWWVFRQCLDSMKPSKEARELLDLLNDPKAWTEENFGKFKGNYLCKAHPDLQVDTVGYVVIDEDWNASRMSLGWLERRRVEAAARKLAHIKKREKLAAALQQQDKPSAKPEPTPFLTPYTYYTMPITPSYLVSSPSGILSNITTGDNQEKDATIEDEVRKALARKKEDARKGVITPNEVRKARKQTPPDTQVPTTDS
jgi:hypothetical protein